MDNRVNETASFDLPRPLAPTPQAAPAPAAAPAGAEVSPPAQPAQAAAPLPSAQADASGPGPAAAATGPLAPAPGEVTATEAITAVLPAPAPPAAPAPAPAGTSSPMGQNTPCLPAAPDAGHSVRGGGWPTSATEAISSPQAAPIATQPATPGPVQLTGQSASFLAEQSAVRRDAPQTKPVPSPYSPWRPAGAAMPDYGQQTGTNHLPAYVPATGRALPGGAQAVGFSGGYGAESHPGVAPASAAHPVGEREQPVRTRRGPTWLGVTGIALACSLAASAGTFALMGGGQNQEQASAGGVTTIAPLVDANGETPNWQAVQQAVGDSVVSIELEVPGGGSSGSGVVIDKDGHIVTNHHVVAGAIEGKVTVTLADGRIYDGQVVGSDSATDLAVVKLDSAPADLSVATLGSSENLQVGQAVAAIGNPLGYASTMTTGIISALDRPVWTEQDEATGDAASALTVTNAIQIDASINPGNSGGPLFDAGGRVIGINSSIATIKESSEDEGGSIGLGFAIPVDVAKLIADQIIESGTVQHAFLGVSLAEGAVELNGAGYTGAKVVEVTAGSSAQNAGVQANDVIVALNGKSVASVPALMAAVRAQPVGAQVKLAVVRGGEKLELNATLQARSETEN
ncbi:S1C family serine protease [Buchananella felis]|uniref:S1C family serine protease n=1 Tax=Buchananella felis TaxID=3231492 RepID=UPI0035293940